jgi:hypothetical protein
MLAPATEPILALRYSPELAMAISDSSTFAAKSTNTADCAIPVAKPPKKTNRACQVGVLPCQLRRSSVKQKVAEIPAKVMGSLYRPVLSQISLGDSEHSTYRLTYTPVNNPPQVFPTTAGTI